MRGIEVKIGSPARPRPINSTAKSVCVRCRPRKWRGRDSEGDTVCGGRGRGRPLPLSFNGTKVFAPAQMVPLVFRAAAPGSGRLPPPVAGCGLPVLAAGCPPWSAGVSGFGVKGRGSAMDPSSWFQVVPALVPGGRVSLWGGLSDGCWVPAGAVCGPFLACGLLVGFVVALGGSWLLWCLGAGLWLWSCPLGVGFLGRAGSGVAAGCWAPSSWGRCCGLLPAGWVPWVR